MIEPSITVWVALCVAATGLIASRAGVLGRRLGLIDLPDAAAAKTHDAPTPLMGGLALLVPLGVLLGGMAALPGGMAPEGPGLWLTGLGAGALGAMALGLADDRHELAAWPRLMISAALATALVALVPAFRLEVLHLSFLEAPVHLGVIGMPLAVLCLVGLQNAVNLADGRNGIVLSLAVMWTVVMMPHFAGQTPVFLYLLAALAIVWAFNMRGHLFLGDAGSYGLSFLFGLMAIASQDAGVTNGAGFVSADLVVLLFAVPVLDCLRLIVSRKMKGQSPFERDGDHLHHRLSAVLPWRMGLAVYVALAGLPVALALIAPGPVTPVLIALQGVAYAALLVATNKRRTSPHSAPAE